MRTVKVVHLILAFLVASTMPVAAAAQSDSSTQDAKELRKQLDQLREQMKAPRIQFSAKYSFVKVDPDKQRPQVVQV